MPRPKKSTSDKLAAIAKKHQCLTVETGNVLFCTSCGDSINFDLQHLSARVTAHLGSKSHKEKDAKRNEYGMQVTITRVIERQKENVSTAEQFNRELTNAIVSVNIPIYKLQHPKLPTFIEKWTGQYIPSCNKLRYTNVPEIYEDQLNSIRNAVADNDIYLMIDETIDRCERSQVNVLIGVLDGKPSKPALFHKEFVDRCNAGTIFQVFNKICNLLWTNDVHFERVKLLISDQTAYMVAAGRLIKEIYPDLLHVTCLAHSLNRVAETVRDQHHFTDKFLANLKKVLSSDRRKARFREVTGLHLPPKPVITRWTSWLQAAFFASKHLELIQRFVATLKSKSRCVSKLRSLAEAEELGDELFSLTDFFFLIESTTKLQQQSLKVQDAAKILKEVGENLDKWTLTAPAIKFNSSLEKNPDIKNILCAGDLAFRIKMKFAPLVSADVERSFSSTKRVLTPERCSFSEENLIKHYIITFNNQVE